MGGEINFSGVRTTGFTGTADGDTSRIRDLLLVNLSTLHIQGDFSPRDLERLQSALANSAGADTSATRDQIAARADAAGTTSRPSTATTTTPRAAATSPATATAPTGATTAGATTADAATASATTRDAATAGQTAGATARPPEGYANGRYTEAATDADAREGFRGDRVRAVQQRLADQGLLTGENAVDGFWGPQTQAAYERSQAGERPTADGAARQLTQDIRSGNTEAVTRTLTRSSNAEVRELDSRLPRDDNDRYTTRLPNVAGSDADYAELSNMMLRGRRNEGAAARPDAAQVDDFQEQILRARVSPLSRDLGATHNIGSAWNGTDETAINQVFSRASSAQLQALDQRIRTGVRDENGDTVQFSDGLAGLIRSEIGAGAHRDALLAQLTRE